MGLSRKAWNNVVIFSMLIMIFFLNGLHHKLNPQQAELTRVMVLPEQSFVLAMAYPGVKIERIGTTWRIDNKLVDGTSSSYSAQDLVQIVQMWQNLELQAVEKQKVNPESAISVATFWLAGEELPLSYQLYRGSDTYLLFAQRQQHWLELSADQAKQLFKPIDI
ncbi:hypothetical protein [Pseudoalteromonas luteoviolacea]|uniref:DUF4340 domain-containing protein n=1 Tax=Pseudoalteromonas luteoviolacea (strain 2ta16) TaxID=1353533 RepID=V4HX27_PSEL2|nr:hypothetical protein [Pseudoalteromonas luteoviolacea]ESP95365.1 hypothetical protein PL2TA16_02702 [Pseudoalteromonas luteoviolacea 2ta16]KZN42173.1 hypothetical protein N483_11650 [Pseudoalteromonas luteoviolacea NCIMB 1944]